MPSPGSASEELGFERKLTIFCSGGSGSKVTVAIEIKSVHTTSEFRMGEHVDVPSMQFDRGIGHGRHARGL